MVDSMSQEARAAISGALLDDARREASLEEAERLLAKVADTLVDAQPGFAKAHSKAGKGKGDSADYSDYEKQKKLLEELKCGKVEGAQSLIDETLLNAFRGQA